MLVNMLMMTLGGEVLLEHFSQHWQKVSFLLEESFMVHHSLMITEVLSIYALKTRSNWKD